VTVGLYNGLLILSCRQYSKQFLICSNDESSARKVHEGQSIHMVVLCGFSVRLARYPHYVEGFRIPNTPFSVQMMDNPMAAPSARQIATATVSVTHSGVPSMRFGWSIARVSFKICVFVNSQNADNSHSTLSLIQHSCPCAL
jgi:hypothetical protein